MKVTIRDLYDLYTNELVKSIKNKKKLRDFELHKMEYLNYCVNCLNNPNYMISKYNIFMIEEPKKRIIMSLNICDKLINHYFTRKVLLPYIEPKLINRNVATRCGLGTGAGVNYVKSDIESLKNKGEIFALKIDISKYFYSISHKILLNMLCNLDKDNYLRVKKILDSTDLDYVNESINKIRKKNNVDLPLYREGYGLPIGNLSSQCLSIYYLHQLDFYIVHSLRCKHYVRYMDDLIILDNDKDKLKIVKDIVISKLEQDYLLKPNYKKTFIVSLNTGIEFLGKLFKIKNNKTIITLRKSSVKIMKRNIRCAIKKYYKNKVTFENIRCILMNYSYSYKNNKMLLRNYIKKVL